MKFHDFNSDFANWSQKSRSGDIGDIGDIGQTLKVFLSMKCYEIWINQIVNYQKLQS